MSYILDALRRADAERQRGNVPGLHDLPLASTLNNAALPPATRSRRLGLAALALAMLGLAGGAGWLLRPVGLAASGSAAAPGAAAVVQPPLPTVAMPGPALPLSPAVLAALPPGPTARPPPTPAAAATSRRPPLPASSPPARLPTLADLPEAQRRELGPLVVGGAMHAEQAALRIVILNGQVMHEGDTLGPDLLVQQIRLKSVVLSHRGQRFELPF